MDEGRCIECGYEDDWNRFLDAQEEKGAQLPICPECGSENVELIEEATP